ncbi:helix-turn-helix transcriptional regulator [Frankia canadensis]|uniref:helix-turn-helix transcriptional regulator n=1 Tax=Frankia canadensis TaxID=1836972 RepID=UPI001FAF9EAF|nr:WYL domain-containing protein [Frankia canadensis]
MSVSRRRVERLLNLTMCLMATSRFLTVSQLGELVEGYEPGVGAEEQDAFRRMFERDKAYLREIGIPLETGTDSALSDEVGYRIRRGDYALPDIALAPDEAAALALAGSLWSSTALAGPAASALRKLAAGGAAVDEGGGLAALDGFEPRVDAAEPAFEPCLAAVQSGRAIRFPYRKVGEAAVAERQVEPWGVLSWRGRWYLVGHDLVRAAPRVFRLSRVAGTVRLVGPAGAVRVPPGTDLHRMVSAQAPPERTRTATLAVRRGAGHTLRRGARPAGGFGCIPPARPRPAVPADLDLLEREFSDTERFARWIVGAGPDVLVVDPPDLRAAVVARLRAAAAGTAPGERDAAAGPDGACGLQEAAGQEEAAGLEEAGPRGERRAPDPADASLPGTVGEPGR